MPNYATTYGGLFYYKLHSDGQRTLNKWTGGLHCTYYSRGPFKPSVFREKWSPIMYLSVTNPLHLVTFLQFRHNSDTIPIQFLQKSITIRSQFRHMWRCVGAQSRGGTEEGMALVKNHDLKQKQRDDKICACNTKLWRRYDEVRERDLSSLTALERPSTEAHDMIQ